LKHRSALLATGAHTSARINIQLLCCILSYFPPLSKPFDPHLRAIAPPDNRNQRPLAGAASFEHFADHGRRISARMRALGFMRPKIFRQASNGSNLPTPDLRAPTDDFSHRGRHPLPLNTRVRIGTGSPAATPTRALRSRACAAGAAGPNGGVADSLDEAKGGVPGGVGAMLARLRSPARPRHTSRSFRLWNWGRPAAGVPEREVISAWRPMRESRA